MRSPKKKNPPTIEILAGNERYDATPIELGSPNPAATLASPLFRLPRELRDRIWEYVLAGHLLHVVSPSLKSKKAVHVVCRADISDVLANALGAARDNTDAIDRGYWDRCRGRLPPGQGAVDYDIQDKRLRVHGYRHSYCFADAWALAGPNNDAANAWLSQNSPAKARGRAADRNASRRARLEGPARSVQVPLAVMRTCRAVYREAFERLWSGNSFAFARRWTTYRFLSGRTHFQAEGIRHIAVRIEHIMTLQSQLNAANPANRNIYDVTNTWVDALELLPNLVSVYLSAVYEVDLTQLESLWCRYAPLEGGKEAGQVAIIDHLAAKPALTAFWPNVEAIVVRPRAHGSSAASPMIRIDGLKHDLEQWLRRRVLHGKAKNGRTYLCECDDSAGSSCSVHFDDQQLEHRTNAFEEWKRKNLKD